MNETIKRRTEITIETRSVTIIKITGGNAAKFSYCRNCEKMVTGLSGTRTALIFQTAFAEIERLSQNGQIHLIENGDLCGNSLAAFFGQEIRCVED